LHGSMPLMLWSGTINEGITFMPINNKHKWLLHNREVGSLLSLTSRDFVLWFRRLVLNLILQWILGQGMMLNIVNEICLAHFWACLFAPF
jgi:hypothetical protein